jgi:hypothetical protein
MTASPKVPCPRCVVCSSKHRLELNHVGGRNHVAWFTMWFCQAHHRKYHAQLTQLGVDLAYTSDPIERYTSVQKAIAFCAVVIADAQYVALSARKMRERKHVRQAN